MQAAKTNGLLWPSATCTHFTLAASCAAPRHDPSLTLGTTFPPRGTLPPGAQSIDLAPGVPGVVIPLHFPANTVLLAWKQRDGLILYDVVKLQANPLCTGWLDCLSGAANLLVFDDFKTLADRHAPWYSEVLAGVGVASDVFVVGKLLKVGKLGGAFVEAGRVASASGRGSVLGKDLAETIRKALRIVRSGCTCFPAGTGVATTHGGVPIERLHVGDMILAEDPAKGNVEQEPVQAVIDDGLKPLLALALSDGSTLRVTSDHPFWVDGGMHLNHAGWLPAGQLQPGDALRTAGGKHVTVLAVRWNVGEAHVYTLTVAHDHTFFAGAARVLVHNARSCTLKGVIASVDGTITEAEIDQLAATGLHPAPWNRLSSAVPNPIEVGRIQGYEFGPLDAQGRATGFIGRLDHTALEDRIRKNAIDVTTLVGYQADDQPGHLLADVLGGPFNNKRNFIPILRQANNTMQGVEQTIINRLRSGADVFYRVVPVYEDGLSRPIGIQVSAFATDGWSYSKLISNR